MVLWGTGIAGNRTRVLQRLDTGLAQWVQTGRGSLSQGQFSTFF